MQPIITFTLIFLIFVMYWLNQTSSQKELLDSGLRRKICNIRNLTTNSTLLSSMGNCASKHFSTGTDMM